jgi:hypothetical protein
MSILKYVTVSNKNALNTDEFKEVTTDEFKEVTAEVDTELRVICLSHLVFQFMHRFKQW